MGAMPFGVVPDAGGQLASITLSTLTTYPVVPVPMHRPVADKHFFTCCERVLIRHIASENAQADTRPHPQQADTPTGVKTNPNLNQ